MLRTKTLMTLAAVAVLGMSTMAHAAPIVILYDSFESPDISGVASGRHDTPAPFDWFDVGHPNTSGLVHENIGTFTTPHGNQALHAWQGNQGGAQHNLGGELLEDDMEYAISFNVAKRGNEAVGDYRAELWADGVLLDLIEGFVTTNDMSEGVTHTFDTSSGTAGQALQLRMVDPAEGQIAGGGSWRAGPYYDNLELTKESTLQGDGSVPEPATATLALLGLGGLMMRRRRNE